MRVIQMLNLGSIKVLNPLKVTILIVLALSIAGCSKGTTCRTTVTLDKWQKMTKEERKMYEICTDENGKVLPNY